jgi:CRP-like cAMP-binding protein
MSSSDLGKLYNDGEVIIHQGDVGNCMYVIQKGQVEIVLEDGDGDYRLALRKEGDFIGEMAIFDRDVRSATVRAVGEARLLTVDKRNFMRRVHEDPALAFRLVEGMSKRIRELCDEVSRLRGEE